MSKTKYVFPPYVFTVFWSVIISHFDLNVVKFSKKPFPFYFPGVAISHAHIIV